MLLPLSGRAVLSILIVSFVCVLFFNGRVKPSVWEPYLFQYSYLRQYGALP